MDNYAVSLKRWNLFVVFVHTSSFIALTIIAIVNSATNRRVDMYVTLGSTVYNFGSYPIAATLIPFPAITAIFHLLAASNVQNYYKDVLIRGKNSLRWLEYSITNGLMSWSLTFIAGNGAHVLLAVTCVLSNFVMQYFGYLHEKSRKMLAIWLGFIPWGYNWAVVLIYFGARLRLESVSVSDSLAIFGSLVWSLCFVAPLVYRYFSVTKSREEQVRVNYMVELAYIMLSLSAKLWLDWTITIGNLV